MVDDAGEGMFGIDVAEGGSRFAQMFYAAPPIHNDEYRPQTGRHAPAAGSDLL